MMVKKAGLSLLFTVFLISVFAQDEPQAKARHYAGVQVNQLVRQILNFSNSNSAANNPYLLNYAVNSVTNGMGLNVGLGYNFSETIDGDAITKRETKIDELYVRAGWEKKSRFGKKMILTTGFDILAERVRNRSITDGFGGSTSTVTKNDGWGLGPRVALSYVIFEKLLIGTEVSYYFKSITYKETGTFGIGFPQRQTKVQFGAPAAIFLTLKF